MTGLNLPWIRTLWLDKSWVQLVLATPVLLWCGADFFKNAWKAFKRHTATMDTLVAMGTGAAYFYSLFATVFPGFFTDAGLMPDVYYQLPKKRIRQKHHFLMATPYPSMAKSHKGGTHQGKE
ncbi:hypothetical protein ANSO36C_66430 (plasmid) [Nostoc cf. commune SO-36]|uniref:Uncharacterized protein n=2 Tax=Nostoc commune TaxID=1178 RepID=A0ABN6QCE9_NOSCO|nr:hypothetical protein ANSO36C_66430 [Nostoc cf. commune SO-36]